MTQKDFAVLATWWRSLQPDQERKIPGERAGDRAALARLRRSATPSEAALEPRCVELARKLGIDAEGYEGVALAAGVLAHLREDTGPGSVARKIGVQDDKTSSVSWLRVRRLLQAETNEERMTAFRRLVHQMGRKAPLHDLAACLLDWSEERRRRFVFDFHAAPIPTPAPSQEPSA